MAGQPVHFWQGAFVNQATARRLMAEPWEFLELDGGLHWRRLFHTNEDRLNSDHSQHVFVRPPDYISVISFKLYWNHEFIRIFRNTSNRSNAYFLCVKRGPEIVFPTRVLQVSMPKFEQGGFIFQVTGMNGDFIGDYNYKVGDRVTIKRLINRVRLDLDPSFKDIQACMCIGVG